jgi:hypothetical protein
MFELNPLPITGGVIAAGITSAALFGFVLGPLVADRSILNSGWHELCVADLKETTTAARPQAEAAPSVDCKDLMGVFGEGADQLCDLGGDIFVDILTLDPLAAQKEQARNREKARLSRIANLAPSRCSCATSLVSADRLEWGLYAGSARLIGGPDDLTAALTEALHAPSCARLGEG